MYFDRHVLFVEKYNTKSKIAIVCSSSTLTNYERLQLCTYVFYLRCVQMHFHVMKWFLLIYLYKI